MGVRVLWEDEALWAVVKPAGVLSEDGQGMNVPALIREATGASYVGIVHRLDKEAAGVMVYAKTPASAAYLSSLVAGRQMEKDYLAVVTAARKRMRANTAITSSGTKTGANSLL